MPHEILKSRFSRIGDRLVWVFIFAVLILAGSGTFHLMFSNPKPKISVVGHAEEAVLSDSGEWSLTLVLEGGSLQEVTEKLHTQEQIVRQFLAEEGLSGADVHVAPLHTAHKGRGMWDEDGQKMSEANSPEYTLRATLQIKTPDVRALEGASSNFKLLINQGLQVSSQPAKFTVKNLEAVEEKLIEKAQANAWKRAGALLKPGETLRLIRADQEKVGFPKNNFADTKNIERTLEAEVKLEFSVQ